MAPKTIEEKLQVLAECGLKLKAQFRVSELIEAWGHEALDEPGFDMALVCLGMTQESPPWTPHCTNLWHFDYECIAGDGCYVKIATRMVEMAQGSLPLLDIQDHVDLEAGEAWLRFTCSGKLIKIDCEVNGDWADAKLFENLAQLLSKCDPNKVFIHCALGGQDCIIGCVTCEQYKKLRSLIPKMKVLK